MADCRPVRWRDIAGWIALGLAMWALIIAFIVYAL